MPDSPHRIARGIFAGVFASFTPFYGFHFITAALIARTMRGNILASLLTTFIGNPLTFPLIAYVSLKLGHWMLGSRFLEDHPASLVDKFSSAADDMWHNAVALFTPETAQWHGLERFYEQVFLPYLVGGIVPGIVAASIAYYVSLPLITAYQNRRRLALRRKFESLRAAAAKAKTRAIKDPAKS